MKPTVNILVTIPRAEEFDSCTYCFESIRRGFPTADLKFHINPITPPALVEKAILKLTKTIRNYWVFKQPKPLHLGYWIKRVIENHEAYDEPGPLVILDADTCFWKSCEDWQFNSTLAGYYVPYMWNDFSQCPSHARLHTSFLWINDTELLLKKVREAYPNSHAPLGEYCPCEPFMPAVMFVNGQPEFWDCCSVLYNMIGGTPFDSKHLECYSHLNSASCFEVMHERLENKDGFDYLHHTLAKRQMSLPCGDWWGIQNAYYQRKHVQAMMRKTSNERIPQA